MNNKQKKLKLKTYNNQKKLKIVLKMHWPEEIKKYKEFKLILEKKIVSAKNMSNYSINKEEISCTHELYI